MVLIWVPLSASPKRMRNKLAVIGFLLLFSEYLFSQNPPGEFSLLFYNVENLFDTRDDPETSDEEFTPKGSRRWTSKRLNTKLSMISKAILGAAGWSPPQLIALCETENRYVLERLLQDTPLHAYSYRIIHKDSPDPRGIDVALLYDEEAFYPLHYQYIPVTNEEGVTLRTREVLYVQGILNGADTLHLFVNHWPSRYGGFMESRKSRRQAAGVVRAYTDSLLATNRKAKIVVTGDFNDQPTDESLRVILNACIPVNAPDETTLYNLSVQWMDDNIRTLKHQSQWSVFDQIIVSGSLLDTSKSFYTQPGLATVVRSPYLLEEDTSYGHLRLFRTYYGYRYRGGFSDHLPVLLQFKTNPLGE